MTMSGLRRSVDAAWLAGDFKGAARLILRFPVMDGRAGPVVFWIDWANDVLAGRIKPELAERPDIPLWVDGELFVEPLTKVPRRRNGRAHREYRRAR